MTIYALPPASQREAFREFMHSDPDDIYGLDCETTAIDETGVGLFDPEAKMRLIQFGSKTDAWVLNPHDRAWRTYIERALRAARLRFASHTNYDSMCCRKEFGIDLNGEDRSIDTHVMARLLFPSDRGGNDLKTLCDEHIDHELTQAELRLHARMAQLAPKGQRMITKTGQASKPLKRWGFTNIPLDDPAYTDYAGLDAIKVRVLLDILAELFKNDRERALSRREQQIKRITNDMQWRGMLIDREHTERLLREVEDEYLAADDRIVAVAGCRPKSPRMPEWLAANGVHFTEFTDGGRGKLDKENMPGLIARYPDNKVLSDLQILSTRQNMLNNLRIMANSFDAVGLVHPAFNTQQAVTGRMSVTDPAMQTFKKTDPRLRLCFVARDGHVFVRADYNSQELYIGAAFSRDRSLLDIINRKIKQHVVTAQRIFGNEYTEEDYKYAKILNFAQQYGAGPKKIGDQMGLPRGPRTDRHPGGAANPEATRLWLAWRETYAGLVRWSERMADEPVVVNPWGRRIPRDRARGYANGNYMIQSSGRDVLGDAIIELHEQGWSQYLWMLIHDEIILEVPIELAEQARVALEECMRCTVNGIELTASGSILGTRWGSD